MKVSFNQTFANNLRRIQSSARTIEPQEIKPGFEKLLFDISPNRPTQSAQEPDIMAKLGKIETVQKALKSHPEDPFARLGLEPPKLELPKVELVGGGLDQVKNSDSAVKKPTLLEVNRVSQGEALKHVKELVINAGNKYGVDPVLGMSVASVESNFDPLAISSDGHESKGLFQLLDTTGQMLHQREGLDQDYDPFNPKMNTELGMSYLGYLQNIFSNGTLLNNKYQTVPAANSTSLEKLAVAAFNAGEGRVASAQARAMRDGKDPAEYLNVESYLPETTQKYVKNVSLKKSYFKENL